MRILVLLVFAMSFSSCLAVFGLGVLSTSLAVGNADQARREGAERDAEQLARHAREASVIRQRYNEAERQEKQQQALTPPNVLLPRELTSPPLVSIEPPRTPLRPRGAAQP
jgi:hypothetical protein